MLTVRKIENCEDNNHLKTLYAEIVTVNILVNILTHIYLFMFRCIHMYVNLFIVNHGYREGYISKALFDSRCSHHKAHERRQKASLHGEGLLALWPLVPIGTWSS